MRPGRCFIDEYRYTCRRSCNPRFVKKWLIAPHPDPDRSCSAQPNGFAASDRACGWSCPGSPGRSRKARAILRPLPPSRALRRGRMRTGLARQPLSISGLPWAWFPGRPLRDPRVMNGAIRPASSATWGSPPCGPARVAMQRPDPACRPNGWAGRCHDASRGTRLPPGA